jgi:flagellar hook-associated protein 2
MSSTSALNSLLSSSSATTNSSVDISSILAAVAGASTPGIDVSAAVSAAIYGARAPERIWQADQTTLSSQMTELQAMQTATASLQTDLQSLNALSGPLSSREVYSSDYSSVSATAATGTSLGTHQISVTNLATTGSWYSDEQASATATLADSSFTLTTASGQSTTVTTGAGGDATLNDVVTDINGQNLGVTASIVTDASGARLSLVSNTSGAAANFSVASNSGSGIAFTLATPGTNASLTVDGVPVTSASNTVTGAISGVTLSLLSPTTAGSPVDLSVQSDVTSVATAMGQFVTDYNSALALLNKQFAFSASTSSQGDLASDPTVRSLQETLQSIADYTSQSSSSASGVSSLSDLGISIGTDGTMSIDTTTLDDVISNSPAAVQNFLQGTALNGFANSAYNRLNNFTDPGDGAFTVDLNSMQTQSTDLTNEISDFETNYIAQQQTSLTADYTTAEEALQSLPTQMTQLQDELGYNSSNNG